MRYLAPSIILSAVSSLIQTGLLAQPSINYHPLDAEVVVGQTPGFSIRATGTGVLTYQWYRNGEAIDGATGYTYFPDPVGPLDEGTEYSIVVTDEVGSTVSEPAYIKISDYSSDIEMPDPDPAGADYHIDSVNGDDATGDGSAEAPFKSFSKIKPLLQGGETVLFHAGSYGSLSFQRQDGEFSDWVTLMAAPGEEVELSQVSLSGTGVVNRAYWSGNYDAWVRLHGFHITSGVSVSSANCVRIEKCLLNLPPPWSGSISAVDRATVGVRIGRSITVEDCEITDTAIGISLRGSDLTVRRNHIHHISHDGIRVIGCDIARIEYNDIYNTDDGANDSVPYARHADGIHLFKEQDGSEDPVEFNNNITIRGNRIFHHESMTIMAQGTGVSRNWTIENNIFGGSGGYMLHLKLGVANCIYRHNTIVNIPGESYQGIYRTVGTGGYNTALPAYSISSGVEVYNNIFYGPVSGQEFIIGERFTDRYDTNLFFNRTYTYPSIGTDAILVSENPLADPEDYDGILSSTTGAIGSGSTAGPLAIDIYGTPRPSPPSIGAVEPVDYTDNEAPTIPQNLTGVPATHSIELFWDPATDNQLVSGYIVYRDGAELAWTHETSFTDRALQAETGYNFSVVAFDPAGNLSGPSGNVSVATKKARADVALWRPAQASSSTIHGEAALAVDSAPLTAWMATDPGPHWLDVDLETAYAVDAIEVVSGLDSGSPVPSFIVEYWDNSAWQGVPGGNVSGNAANTRLIELFPKVTSSRIRFSTEAATVEVNALRIYGEPLDKSAPTAPSNLEAERGIDWIRLSWSPSSDNKAVAGYIIYRGLDEVGRVTASEFTNAGLSSNTYYTYSVVAFDAARNESAFSASVGARTRPIPAWAGIGVVDFESTRVDTGGWLGLVDVGHAPWLWSERFHAWLHAPDPGDVRGTWLYFVDESLQEGIPEGLQWAGYAVDENGYLQTGPWLGSLYRSPEGWMWHYDSGQWLYSQDEFGSVPGAWIWVQQFYWSGQTNNWTPQDLGSVAKAGTVSCDGGTITVTGDGNDVWGSSDHGHFSYMKISGDFDISVRLKSAVTVSDWTKCGIMIRGYNSASSMNVFMLASSNGSQFQVRTANGGQTGWGNYVDGQTPPNTTPTYLRVTRKGNLFTGYFSDDGVKWSMRSNQTVSMPDEVFFGLAVSSHAFGSTATAVFDRLTIR